VFIQAFEPEPGLAPSPALIRKKTFLVAMNSLTRKPDFESQFSIGPECRLELIRRARSLQKQNRKWNKEKKMQKMKEKN